MGMFVTFLFIIFAIVGSASTLHAGALGSILALSQAGPEKLTKAGGDAATYMERIRTSAVGLESMQYRGFTVVLNNLGDGSYEVQATRMVAYGNHRVNSIFSSLYKSSIEFSYKYDSNSGRILQYHFLFPPNSLTGWANPGDYAMVDEFDWNERFPSTCGSETRVYTLEEAGREYMEAGCLPDRESAIRFARNFIDYMRGSRGL